MCAHHDRRCLTQQDSAKNEKDILTKASKVDLYQMGLKLDFFMNKESIEAMFKQTAYHREALQKDLKVSRDHFHESVRSCPSTWLSTRAYCTLFFSIITKCDVNFSMLDFRHAMRLSSDLRHRIYKMFVVFDAPTDQCTHTHHTPHTLSILLYSKQNAHIIFWSIIGYPQAPWTKG